MDSFERPNWNLLQVLAWVYIGDRGLVRRLADGAWSDRSFNQELVGADGRKELVKTSANPPSFLTIEIVAARSGTTIETAIEGMINGVDSPVDKVRSAYASMEKAEEAVLVRLQDGSLTAFGLRNGDGDRVAVPALQWVDLVFAEDPPRAAPRDASLREASFWSDLTFMRKDVLALWPDTLASANDDIAVPQQTNSQELSNTSTEAISGVRSRQQIWIDAAGKIAKDWDQSRRLTITEVARKISKSLAADGLDAETIRKAIGGKHHLEWAQK